VIDLPLLVFTGTAFGLAALVQRREFFQLRWRPTRHTAAALAVGLLAAAFSAAALAVPRGSFAYGIILWGLIFGLCGFTLPWAYALLVERGTPAALGIRGRRWVLSVLVSLLFAGACAYATVRHADLSRYDPGHLVGAAFSLNVGGLFELFLYYGFIHLRLRKAFGPIPAIVGTAAVYSLWHIGTELPLHAEPTEALLMLFVVGVLCQSVFAITYNCLAIWPFFFTAGVLYDFIVHLDLPGEVGMAMGWPIFGWAWALVVPWTIWRYSRVHGAAERGRPTSR
jgi:membrane protease YdiL (CAAX protease family)